MVQFPRIKSVYCAVPRRLKGKREKIISFVKDRGYSPYFPQGETYEDRIADIENIEAHDELWVFGVSEPTLLEVLKAAEFEKPIKTFMDFDPRWRHYNVILGKKLGHPVG